MVLTCGHQLYFNTYMIADGLDYCSVVCCALLCGGHLEYFNFLSDVKFTVIVFSFLSCCFTVVKTNFNGWTSKHTL